MIQMAYLLESLIDFWLGLNSSWGFIVSVSVYDWGCISFWRGEVLFKSGVLTARIRYLQTIYLNISKLQVVCSLYSMYPCWYCFESTVKSFKDSRGAAFVYDWPPPLIFVRFTSNFFCMCSTIGAHVQQVWGKSDQY